MNEIIKLFTEEKIIDISPLGNGHINSTFCVTLEDEKGEKHRIVLQKINSYVFPDIDAVMGNMCKVTEYLKENIKEGEDIKRSVMTVIHSLNGNSYEIVNGEYYRCFAMVEDTVTYETIQSPQDLYTAAAAFADFAKRLAAFPADTLKETIVDFHNTKARYTNFINALVSDKTGRAKEVKTETDWCIKRKHLALEIVTKLNDGIIPLRVVHNDTKLNNILFDKTTNMPLCVVDLDTVMPGAACYDFGDSIRSGGSYAAEDEHNLDKVYLDMELYEACVAGYMSVGKEFLTDGEIDSFIIAPLVITYETALRFLADYLEGDVYFRIHYPDQNLRRFRTQMKLVEDMEIKLPEMERIIRKYTQR